MVDLPDEVRNMSLRPTGDGARPRSDQSRDGESAGRSGAPGGRDDRRGGPSGDRRSSGGPRGARGGGGGRPGRGGNRRRRRRLFGGGKPCPLCIRKQKHVDYKDLETIRLFVSPHGKILPRRMSGACSSHQRMLTTAIKRARNVALLPFAYKV